MLNSMERLGKEDSCDPPHQGAGKSCSSGTSLMPNGQSDGDTPTGNGGSPLHCDRSTGRRSLSEEDDSSEEEEERARGAIVRPVSATPEDHKVSQQPVLSTHSSFTRLNGERRRSAKDDRMVVVDAAGRSLSRSPTGKSPSRLDDGAGKRSQRTSVSSENCQSAASDAAIHSQDGHALQRRVEEQARQLTRADDEISSLRRQLLDAKTALECVQQTAAEERAQLLAARQELMTYQHTLQSSQSALGVQHRVAKALREEASTLQNLVDSERQRAMQQSTVIGQLEQQLQQYRGQVYPTAGQSERRTLIQSPGVISPPPVQRQEGSWHRSPPRVAAVDDDDVDPRGEDISAPPPLTSIQPKAELSPRATSPRPILTPTTGQVEQPLGGRGRWPAEPNQPAPPRTPQDSYLSTKAVHEPRSSHHPQTFKGRRQDLQLSSLQATHGQAITSHGHASGRNGEYAQTAISRFEKIVMVPENAGKLRPYLEQWLQKTDEARQMTEQRSPHPMRSPLLTSPPPHSPAFIGPSPTLPSAVHIVQVPHYSEAIPPPHHRPIVPHPSQLHQVHHPPGTIAIPALRKRKRRLVLEPETRAILEQHFAVRPKPTPDELVQLAQQLDLEKEEVRVWFCNRRQKEKRISGVSSPMRFNWPQPPTQSSPTTRTTTTVAAAATSRPVAGEAAPPTISPGLPLLDSVPAQHGSVFQSRGEGGDDSPSEEDQSNPAMLVDSESDEAHG